MWIHSATKTQRQKWAEISPLAWVLEYQPTILLPNTGEIPFEPYWAQQNMLHDQDRQRILNKMRQGGFSTVFAVAESCWKMIYKPSPSIACISKNEEDAIGFLDKFRLAYNSVKDKDPNWLPLTKDKTKSAENSNGKIKVLPASKGSGRSISATDVYFDEMPHSQYAEQIYQSSYPTISRTGGRFTLFSTPLGKGNKFHEICKNAKDMGYNYHQYEWWFVPEYNPFYKQFMEAFFAKDKKMQEHWIREARKGAWYRTTFSAMGELAFMQEYECNFDANADEVFNTRQLNNVFVKNYLHEVEDGYGDEWEMDLSPELLKTTDFVSFMDYGRKRDPTVIVVFGFIEAKWQLVYYNRITPAVFEWDLVMQKYRDNIEDYQSEAFHDGTGSGDAVTLELQDVSTPVLFTDGLNSRMKSNAIENVKRAMDNKVMVLPKLPQLQKEFEQYRYSDKKLQQDTVMAVVGAMLKAYDPNDSFVGIDKDFSLVGN